MKSRPFRIILTVLGVLVLAAAAVHAYAYAEWRASFAQRPAAEQLAAAERAAALEPWVAAYRARPLWIRGEVARSHKKVATGYFLLHRAADIDPHDPDLHQALHAAYLDWYVATTWKAHVQHGHELPGGKLREQDVER